MANKKILLVDDEAVFRTAVEQALKGTFTVLTATDGIEGFDLAKEKKPDLIMLDILMPKQGGLETLKALKADEATKKIPVVMLTNIEKNEAVVKGISLGARGYFIKGKYSSEELLKEVINLLQ